MADVPIVGSVQKTVTSKHGLIALAALLFVALLVEVKTGALSRFFTNTVGKLPVVGPWATKKVA